MRRFAILLAVVGCTNHEMPPDVPATPDAQASFIPLFDGSSLAGWRMAGRGSFTIEAGALVAQPGDDLGLLWSTVPTPADFVLRLEWRRSAYDDNSGVFIRFPDPDSKGYDNTAYVGVHWGLEIQIDDTGHPDGAPLHTTGAIYEQPNQMLALVPSRPLGEWNVYEIEALGQRYTVRLNGTQVTQLDYGGDPARSDRALPSTPSDHRFIGLQTHTGNVAFRAIEIRAL